MKKPAVQIILLLLISLVSVSCASETDAYARLVAEWQGREIVFPDVMTDVLTGDTLDLSEADFTIVTYVDSTGCTGCRMKLSLWREFLSSLDSVVGERDVNSVMVVNPKDTRELSYLIRRDNYSYSVVNDTSDSLQMLNGFPDDAMFRSFLIDRHRRVVAIGNPVYNPAIANLYRSVISGSRTFSESGAQMITADNSRIKAGEVRQGEERSFTFMLANESADTVKIRDVISSCDCTEAILTDSMLPPAGNRPIKIKFREDSVTGDFTRTVHIFYHGFENPTILEISGTVIK